MGLPAVLTRRRPGGPVILVLVAAATFFAAVPLTTNTPDSYDSEIMVQVAANLVENASVTVNDDQFGLNSPYSSYGIGVSLAMAPLYWVGDLLGADPVAAAFLLNAFVLAAIAAVVAAWAREAGLGWRPAMITAWVTAPATPLLTTVATGFSEPLVALGVALGLLGVERASRGRPFGGHLVGLGSGVALLARTDSAILVIPMLAGGVAWAVIRQHGRSERWLALRRTAAGFTLTLAPAAVVWAVYNHVRFGSPLSTGYDDQPFNHAFLPGVYGLVASPARGIVIYVPVIFVAAAGFVWAWRRRPVVIAVALGLVVVRIGFYASWWAWYSGGGWGPRFLVGSMTALAAGIMALAARWNMLRWPARGVIIAVVAVSCGVQVVGTMVDPKESSLNQRLAAVVFDEDYRNILDAAATPEAEQAIDDVLFGTDSFPVTDQLGMLARGEALTSRFATPSTDLAPVMGLVMMAIGVGWAALGWAPAGTGERRSPPPR